MTMANSGLFAQSADSLMHSIDTKIFNLNKKYLEINDSKSIPKTRGSEINPCTRDYESLKTLSAQLLSAYQNCCNQQTSYTEIVTILMELDNLANNQACDWDENPEMYLLFFMEYFNLGYNLDQVPCSRQCECISKCD